MPNIDEQGRTEPEPAADEVTTLLGFLEFQRATFEWKCRGLDSAGLSTSVAASTMTLGGMMKHLAIVEEGWFSRSLWGHEYGPPWDGVDWKNDPDWEWRTAAEASVDELWALWRRTVETSRRLTTEALNEGGMDHQAKRAWPDGRTPTLRWIVVHMIEEYARHNGHADLIREAVDGETGE